MLKSILPLAGIAATLPLAPALPNILTASLPRSW